MPRLEERVETYFTTVRGMCRTCRRITPARVFFKENHVWQESLCDTCANTPVMIAGDQNWYMENVLQPKSDFSPLPESTPPRLGCPQDCGPCSWHASPCQLPVVSITNACNLKCPICFTYNRPDQVYHMPVAEMKSTVDWIVKSSEKVDLINITGGEPTLHPQLMDIIQICKRPEIGRVTMNSNGLRLAEDPALCAQLAERGVYVILSLDTFDPGISRKIHGRDLVEIKERAINNLTQAGCKMTLLQVMIRGMNEDVSGRILDLMAQNDNILSLTVQTMTHTGQGGGQWTQKEHLPVDEAAKAVCRYSQGQLAFSDFHQRPSSHPLCYQICYMLKFNNRFYPFARFASPEKIAALMKGSYLIRMEENPNFFKEVMDDLFAKRQTDLLRVFRGLVEKLYPSDRVLTAFERQIIAESSVRTVYVHAHMDEDNFDCSRAMLCPDLVPAQPGKLIPACTYNLFYRQKDERFYVPRKG